MQKRELHFSDEKILDRHRNQIQNSRRDASQIRGAETWLVSGTGLGTMIALSALFTPLGLFAAGGAYISLKKAQQSGQRAKALDTHADAEEMRGPAFVYN